VGWMYWSYKDWGDPTTQGQGSGAQSMFRNDAELSSVKQAKLAILERPYPQAIAGVPQFYGFDEDNGVFTMRYSTTLASGKKAPKGLQTSIHVPLLHYPDGYQVNVQGGRVVSPAGAKTLLIEAEDDASYVGIRVARDAR